MMKQNIGTQRVASLDWLRGLMALSIMLYHFVGRDDAATPLGRLGAYGVSIFFILSGLSMAIAYDGFIKDAHTSLKFLILRLFRIWPLLWLAVLLRYAIHPYDAETIALNLTTAFGFIAPDRYINQGAWSIGNEMVYYAITPLLIGAYRWNKCLGNLMTFAAFGVFLVFTFSILHRSASLASQWNTYINPFNNLFLYCSGLAIYYNCKSVTIADRWKLLALVVPIAVLFLFPVSGDQINIVTGVARLVLVSASVLIVVTFYRLPPKLPNAVGNKLAIMGAATYAIYLLHPIVYEYVAIAFSEAGLKYTVLRIAISLIGTLLIAHIVYRRFELPIMLLGKRLVKGQISKPAIATAANRI